jgi:hypothetical protein
MPSDLITSSRRAAVDTFLRKNRESMAAGGRGRLIFALDATGSRGPTWNTAIQLQSEMFAEAAKAGGLQVQLVFFRGTECQASNWTTNANTLADKMSSVTCKIGMTQWAKVIDHIRREHQNKPVSAAVLIGDCCEEPADMLYSKTMGLQMLFVFQEGDDPVASTVFPELARRTGGAHFAFGSNSAGALGALLQGIAVFVAGGLTALEGRKDAASIRLLRHMQ